MRKKMFSFKNFVMAFMAIGLLTSVGCRKQDDSDKEIEKLKEQVQTVKVDLEKKSKELQANLDKAIKSLEELQNKPAPKTISKEELDEKIKEAKDEVLSAAVTVAAFKAYKTEAKEDLTTKLEAQKATLEALIGKKADGTTKITVLEDELDKLKGLKLEDQIADLKNTVSENKTELERLLRALDVKVGNNATAIAGNTTAIADNATAIADNATATASNTTNIGKNTTAIAGVDAKLEDLIAKFNELAQRFNSLNVANVVNDLLSARLTSLVVLPDYVSAGGALPIVNFTALKTNACGLLQADNVTIKYVVNPSSVKLENINVDEMTFRYNDPAVLTARKTADVIQPKVTSATLENGVLTVGVKLNLTATWAATASSTNTENRIDQLMLVVPSKDGKTVVSSDWVRVAYKASEPAIVKYNTNFVLPAELAEAKTATNTVVDMTYNDVLDLSMNVASKTKGDFKSIEHSNYKGLGYKFEFVENTVSGTTNTQAIQFVQGSTSTVTTKVYGDDLEKLEATIGSTPIVKVTLKSEDCEKVTEGYLKLNIVDARLEDKTREVAPVEAEITASCTGSDTTTTTVAEVTQEMLKEVYAKTGKVGVTAAKFHNDYMLQTVSSTAEVGTVAEVKNGANYKVAYILTEKEIWDNVGKTVEKTATYVNKKNPNNKVKMTFKVAIAKETVKFNIAVDNYWYDNYAYVIQNSSVPPVGIVSETATFANNIAQAFVIVDNNGTDKRVNLNNGVTPADKYKDYTYEFIFDKAENQPIKTVKGHKGGDIVISVSANGKELKATQGSTVEETIATIKDQSTAEGDILEYNKTSKLGKWLLNNGADFMKARVVLVVKNPCDKRVNVEVNKLPAKDRFDIHFLRPVNLEGESKDFFVDAVDGGSKRSVIDIKDVLNPYDWREVAKIGNPKEYYFSKHPKYYDFYGVSKVEVVKEDIKVEGLTVGGEAHTTLQGTNIEVNQTDIGATIGGVTYTYGRLTYVNNGNNLKTGFTLLVPVKVTYLWGEITTVVKVPVKPTSSTARKAAK